VLEEQKCYDKAKQQQQRERNQRDFVQAIGVRESAKNYIFLLLLLTFYLVIVCWLAE
jgi:hypothetical protein